MKCKHVKKHLFGGNRVSDFLFRFWYLLKTLLKTALVRRL